MALKFNINERTLIKGFGLPLVKRAILESVVDTKLLQQDADVNYIVDAPDGKSRFGTPVYGTVLIQEPKYSFYKYNESTQQYDLKDNVFSPSNKEIGGVNYVYIEGAIIEITQPRNIVKTAISGMDGTIKEFINNGDYSIKIMGYFSTVDPDIYPETEVKALKEYLTAPVTLNITNKFLNTYFGVNGIVVDSFEFKQVEGMRNVQYFTINASSDYPFDVIELNK